MFIHPLRQKHIRHLVENVPEGTKYVYLFGSSLLPSLHQESDVDVALIGDIDLTSSFLPMKLPDCEYDILTFSSMDELRENASRSIQNTERSILEGGLLVYAKE
jgi:predicted nucleotidyltransferase